MAICGGCKAETSRIRTTFDKSGVVLKEECDHCAPNSFDPQWLHGKGAMAWEAYPDKYKQIRMPDGSIGYVAKDEWRADSEAKLSKGSEDERIKYEAALEEKRNHSRKTPLTPEEVKKLVEKVRPKMAARAQAEKEEKEKARMAWLMP